MILFQFALVASVAVWLGGRNVLLGLAEYGIRVGSPVRNSSGQSEIIVSATTKYCITTWKLLFVALGMERSDLFLWIPVSASNLVDDQVQRFKER